MGTPERLLRLEQVEDRTGKKKSSIYAEVKDETFPPPVKLGKRASRWVESEVDDWIARQIAVRDAG